MVVRMVGLWSNLFLNFQAQTFSICVEKSSTINNYKYIYINIYYNKRISKYKGDKPMKLLISQLLKPRASADITNNYLLTKYKCVGVMVTRG